MEELVTCLVIIYGRSTLIFPARVDAINLQTHNSPDLSPRFGSLALVRREGISFEGRQVARSMIRRAPSHEK